MAGCLNITVGISGSGKSKFAEFFCNATDAMELNADNYRKELGKDVNDQDINKVVFEEIDKAIETLGTFLTNLSNRDYQHFDEEVERKKKEPQSLRLLRQIFFYYSYQIITYIRQAGRKTHHDHIGLIHAQ